MPKSPTPKEIRMRHLLLARLLAGIAVMSPLSAPAADANWKLEPKDVFGIAIGAGVKDLAIPDCKKERAALGNVLGEDLMTVLPGPTCVTNRGASNSKDVLYLANLPAILPPGRLQGAKINIKDGKMISVEITLPKPDYKQMAAILTERYGDPTRRERNSYQNGFGAKFEFDTVQWAGISIGILLSEHESDSATSLVTFYSVPLMAEEIARDRQSVKDAAAKF